MKGASLPPPTTLDELTEWIKRTGTVEVECLIPDMNGIVRGKVVPAPKVVAAITGDTLRMPISVFTIGVTGAYPEDNVRFTGAGDRDGTVAPDLSTIRVAPGYKNPTAYIVCDVLQPDGTPVSMAPRQVLKTVLSLYHKRGWRPIVAPELEFYLTAPNPDPDLPFQTPIGRNGRAETTSEPYGLEAINEHEDLVEELYDFAETALLGIDTLIHEAGAAQLEFNFHHGNPLDLADRVFVAKRIIRQVAQRHGIYATFMAKPMELQPGSAMHIHQSIVDMETGKSIFSNEDAGASDHFLHFLGGLQHYLPQVIPLVAPNVNSFRRMRPQFDAPINLEWGNDNRTCGLRIPRSDAQNRRIENRLAGADANPYLAIAASLLCGWLGMEEKRLPRQEVTESAYQLKRTLPRTLHEALDRFAQVKPFEAIIGADFMGAFVQTKEMELDAYQAVISSWERENLALKV
jgi:glutamine synthetase